MFNYNIIKNPSGELTSERELQLQNARYIDEEYLTVPWPNYPYWRIWSSGHAGWKVLKYSEESQMINPKVYLNHQDLRGKNLRFPVCFYTSYHSCTKDQKKDLNDYFVKPKLSVLETDLKFRYLILIHIVSKNKVFSSILDIYALIALIFEPVKPHLKYF